MFVKEKRVEVVVRGKGRGGLEGENRREVRKYERDVLRGK
jgi:hypothetical protein